MTLNSLKHCRLLPLLLLLLPGCAVKHVAQKAYRFAYCDQLKPDGTCQHWATPCGTLDCKE